MARTFTDPYMRAALAAVLSTGMSAGASGAPEPVAALFALKAGNVRFVGTEGEAPGGAAPQMSIKGGSPWPPCCRAQRRASLPSGSSTSPRVTCSSCMPPARSPTDRRSPASNTPPSTFACPCWS